MPVSWWSHDSLKPNTSIAAPTSWGCTSARTLFWAMMNSIWLTSMMRRDSLPSLAPCEIGAQSRSYKVAGRVHVETDGMDDQRWTDWRAHWGPDLRNLPLHHVPVSLLVHHSPLIHLLLRRP